MKILHYALGYPPFRTGGLTKYCVDLMLSQAEQGHEVAMLWPGRMSLLNKKIQIKKKINYEVLKSFELINPLPVALDEGIKDVDAFIRKGDQKYYRNFLKSIKPDVIHIHTLMGIHREFLLAAKELSIKTVFTTHDYYGLCPKVTLFRDGNTCDDDNECKYCVKCNRNALSIKKIIFLQSPLYRGFKDSFIVKKLRSHHRKTFFSESEIVDQVQFDEDAGFRAREYRRLRQYYISMYKLIEIIHFNSTLSHKIYTRYFNPLNYKVCSISHRGISDNRKEKAFSGEKLRITFLAPTKPFKGFRILKEALDELWQENYKDFILNIYGPTSEIRPYMKIQDGYQYSELEDIFDRTDLLVAPSVWYETFGFTVLEALSYGVPVLVSENVGAKDVLDKCGAGICIQLSKESLKKSVLSLMNKDLLREINLKICKSENIFNPDWAQLY